MAAMFGWPINMNIIYDIPFYKQKEVFDCGITCIKMVSEYFDKVLSLGEIKSYYKEYSERSWKANSNSCTRCFFFYKRFCDYKR